MDLNPQEKLSSLGARELEVLTLICDGLTRSEIAERLTISPNTVRSTKNHIYMKLGLKGLDQKERLNLILRVYCPALSGQVVVGDDDPGQTVDVQVDQSVEEDERAIDLFRALQKVPPPPPPPVSILSAPGPKVSWSVLVIVVLLSMLAGGLLIRYLFPLVITQLVPVIQTQIVQITPDVTLTPTPKATLTPFPPTSTPTVSPTRTSTPTETPTKVYLVNDGFGKDFGPWWTVTAGEPQIARGKLTALRDTWMLVGDETWKNYLVTFTTYYPMCTNGFNTPIHIGVRVKKDIRNMASITTNMCQVWGEIVRNNVYQIIPNTLVSTALGANPAPVLFRISVEGEEINAQINGQPTSFIYKDNDSGGIAINISNEVILDDFKVEPLP